MGKHFKEIENLQRSMLFFMALQLFGCSIPFFGGYGSESRSREEFAHYVEAVFRLQNNVTSQLMILMESVDIQSQQPLLKAEQRMQELCNPINEYASRDIDGLYIGLFLRRRVEKSAEECDKAARQVEELLNGFDTHLKSNITIQQGH